MCVLVYVWIGCVSHWVRWVYWVFGRFVVLVDWGVAFPRVLVLVDYSGVLGVVVNWCIGEFVHEMYWCIGV